MFRHAGLGTHVVRTQCAYSALLMAKRKGYRHYNASDATMPAMTKGADISEIFLKPYNATEQEPQILERWEKSGYTNPDNLPNVTRGSYTIVLPPPNVTGTLHMGHASMLAIQDILIRYHRMRGFKTLWLPGTDHAAIATQSVVEKELSKTEKKTRHDLGRDVFLKRVEEFAQKSHDTIVSQVRAMGASVDWSREAFTLDRERNLAVRTAFKNMYDAGLIYRGERIVNWDPKGQTTISDDEIVHETRKTKLYTFRYWKDFPIPVATTRLETKVGDTAVAVHPDDERYAQYVGQTFSGEFCGVPLEIKIVADETVEKEFGTGALGVTPAHSAIDWDIAKRHNLPLKQVINEYGKMTVGGELLEGKKTAEAREIVAETLRREGLIEKEEDIEQNVSTAERTGGVIEPLPKLQWWIAVNKEFEKNGKTTTLKQIMREAVESGATKITPERFEKIYYNWIDNLRDWCISRQIWYGHRIPVWYKDSEVYVGIEAPEGAGWEQDGDTLDTWFSSGLWTFSTLGWPEETEDLKTFHPTDVLETGYDILFFWVARMILMTGFNLGTVPFKNVYLHGLVRDAQGRKMSKSLGNILNPLDMIQKYGADATRLSLIMGAAPGNDVKLSEDRIRGYKNFANKLWNIARFVLENTTSVDVDAVLNDADQKLLDEAKAVATSATRHIESFRLDLALDEMYHYVWDIFAAEILEESKLIFKNPVDSGGGGISMEDASISSKASRERVLTEILLMSLRVLHPFMPFVTEAIWKELPQKDTELLMVAPWPVQ